MIGKGKGMRITCQAGSIAADRVPDMGKRQLMNLLLLGAVSLPAAGMLIPYASFFAPPGSASNFSESLSMLNHYVYFNYPFYLSL